MKAIKRRVALFTSGVLAVTSIWACTATRNGDGSMTFRFAPDMAITAFGLEQALDKLVDLLGQCNSGSFPRPCTQSERDDISRAIRKVLDTKARMESLEPPESAGDAEVG